MKGEGSATAKGKERRPCPAARCPPRRPPLRRRPAQRVGAGTSQISAMARRLLGTRDQIIVEGFADRGDSDKNAASLARASRVRERLIRDGVPADRVVAVGRGEQPGHAGGVRVVQAPPPAAAGRGQAGRRTGARPPCPRTRSEPPTSSPTAP